jgi:hypothetical protein
MIEDLQRQNVDLRNAMANMADGECIPASEANDISSCLITGLRAEGMQRHEDTLNAVRAAAQEQVHFNVQGYLDDFSKTLAAEVRMLLSEVGKLREDRRALWYELSCLFALKSKYGPGGEFDPDW